MEEEESAESLEEEEEGSVEETKGKLMRTLIQEREEGPGGDL